MFCAAFMSFTHYLTDQNKAEWLYTNGFTKTPTRVGENAALFFALSRGVASALN